MKYLGHLCLSTSLVALLGAAPFGAAWARDAGAQPSGPVAGQVEEIIVTSQKRSENLQTTAAAINAIPAASLTTLGVTDIRSAQLFVQAANLQTEGSNSQLYVRGIGSFLDTASITPLVTTVIGGLAVPREATGAPFFDISQLEVLPGPQGTLYGRSGAGGIITVNPNRPTLGSNASSGSIEFGTYQTIHPSTAQNFAVGDNLDFRLATDYIHHSGYEKSGAYFEDTPSIRLSGIWQATPKLSVYAWAQYAHIDTGFTLVQTRPSLHGGDSWNDLNAQNQTQVCPACGADNRPIIDVPVAQGFTEFTYRFDNHMTLSYSAGAYEVDQKQIQAQGTESTTGDPLSNNWSDRYAHIKGYTQELKLLSPDDSALKWIAGLYWYQQNYNYNFRFNGGTPTTFVAFDDPNANEGAYVAYGQATVPITHWLRGTIGARYQSFHKDDVGYTASVLGGPRGTPFTFNHTWTPLTWKLGLEADLADNVFGYVTVQTDWGAGTYNEFPSTPTQSNLVEPSKLMAYTGGIKSRFFDRRLQVNFEVFHYLYDDLIIQSFNNVTGVGGLFSPPKTTITGAELNTIFHPTANDEFILGSGWLDTKIDTFTLGTVTYAGLGLQQAPQFTASLGYKHRWDLSTGASVELFAMSHASTVYWLTFDKEPATLAPGYTKTDATLTYTNPTGRWTAGLWVKNIENTAVFTTAGAGTLPDGRPYIDTYIASPPRTVGIRLTFKTE